jgi:hypothetical protein
MIEQRLQNSDVLGLPHFLSDPGKPFIACLRIVWREAPDGKFEAIGHFFTVETSDGIVAIHPGPIGSIADAEIWNAKITPDLTAGPFLIEFGEQHPDVEAQWMAFIADEARHFVDEPRKFVVRPMPRTLALAVAPLPPGDTSPVDTPRISISITRRLR